MTGVLIREDKELDEGLARALDFSRRGDPVLVNVLLDKTEFRKGSISM